MPTPQEDALAAVEKHLVESGYHAFRADEAKRWTAKAVVDIDWQATWLTVCGHIATAVSDLSCGACAVRACRTCSGVVVSYFGIQSCPRKAYEQRVQSV